MFSFLGYLVASVVAWLVAVYVAVNLVVQRVQVHLSYNDDGDVSDIDLSI